MATRKKDRFFALFGAILFLITSSALTIIVIWTNTHQNSTSPTTTACSDSAVETTYAAPTVYKTTGAVTALQATDLQVGTGPAAKSGDCLIVKYYGTIASSGVEFDQNFTEPTAFAFTLGQGQVIPGWDQGLVGMKAGGARRLVIPSSLAYGDQANSTIPANSDLVFDVKLLRIQ